MTGGRVGSPKRRQVAADLCEKATVAALLIKKLGRTPGPVQVTNKAGGGGAIAYAEVVAKRNTDNIVAPSSSTTTRLAERQYAGFTADRVRWLGGVGAEYGMIAGGCGSNPAVRATHMRGPRPRA